MDVFLTWVEYWQHLENPIQPNHKEPIEVRHLIGHLASDPINGKAAGTGYLGKDKPGNEIDAGLDFLCCTSEGS